MNLLKNKTDEYTISVIYPDLNKEMIDIDFIFRQTNRSFADLLNSLCIKVNFDFKNRDNKKLYMNEFVKTFVEFIKNRKGVEKIYFFSNKLSKDDFRNGLIKKLKTIFGFDVYEWYGNYEDFIEKIESGHCEETEALEIYLNKERKPKSFKHVKKYFEKHGFVFLKDVYFKDFTNKLHLLV